MTDHNDELLDLLRSADPVDPDRLPDPGDSAAQDVLERVMYADGAGAPVRFVEPPRVVRKTVVRKTVVRKTRVPAKLVPAGGFGGRALIGAVAAVVLLVAGVLTFAPGGAAPALAVVQGAAAETSAVGSGRVTSSFDLEHVDGATTHDEGQVTLEAVFSGSDVAISVTSVESDDPARDEWAGQGEVRLVDGVAYVNGGDTWMSTEVGGLLGATVVDYLDPRSVLSIVNDLTEAEEIGPATVAGLEVTHYRGVVDLAGESMMSLVGGLDPTASSIEVEGEATLDLYIDRDGLLRRLDISGEAREPGNDDGVLNFSVSTVFDDLGAELSIEAPADATPVDIGGFTGEGLGGFDG